jgi:hypothetical protein
MWASDEETSSDEEAGSNVFKLWNSLNSEQKLGSKVGLSLFFGFVPNKCHTNGMIKRVSFVLSKF